MQYQQALKHICYYVCQCYYSFEFDFPATNAMPGLFNQASSGPPIMGIQKKHPHKKTSRNKDLAHYISEKPSKNESEAVVISIPVASSIDSNAADKKSVDDWIVVRESKKSKRPSSIATTPKSLPKKQQRVRSNKGASAGKKTTANIKTTKKSVPKTNTHTPTPTSTSLEKKNASHHAWSNIVSQDIQTIKQQDISEEHDSVPCLSDSESIAGSIESPCLSSRGLVHEEEDDKPNYYSPFSTGFDFGVSVPIVVEKSRSYTPVRLDKSLLYQRWTHPVNNTSKKSSNHTTSILNLLNQADQVETSITADSFRYFDEMMMSNSLYKSYRSTTTAEQDDEWMRNRQNWNSIASSFVR